MLEGSSCNDVLRMPEDAGRRDFAPATTFPPNRQMSRGIFQQTPKDPGGQPSKDRMFGTTCRPHFRVPDETSKTGYRCAYCAKEVRPNRNSTMKPLEVLMRSGGRLGCGSELRRQGGLKDVGGDNMLAI